MSATRPAKAGRPPWGTSKVAKPHLLVSVMREHACIARDNLRVAMASHQGLQAVPGGR